jgi:predicted O-linked N-acetylglucosamine transferase (SPINDLY family)
LRQRLEAAFEHFHDVGTMSDRDIAALMREHEIDVVVDLMGPTQNARPGILAHRPAPVQALYLGYAGSSGAAFVDCVLADRIVIPAEQRAFYPEKILNLPDCFMATDATRPIADRIPSRMEEGLPAHGFVFCAFSNGYKITPAMFDAWMELLRVAPDSVLWLAGTNARAVGNLKRAAAERQITPERLVFARRHESNAVHLARYAHADLFLDTAPYGAHSTACEALWAGVPVLTVKGETFAGRVAASLLKCLGLPDLVCESLPAYKDAALRFAANPNEARALKEKVAQAQKTSPLFDTERFTRALEAKYLQIVRR